MRARGGKVGAWVVGPAVPRMAWKKMCRARATLEARCLRCNPHKSREWGCL